MRHLARTRPVRLAVGGSRGPSMARGLPLGRRQATGALDRLGPQAHSAVALSSRAIRRCHRLDRPQGPGHRATVLEPGLCATRGRWPLPVASCTVQRSKPGQALNGTKAVLAWIGVQSAPPDVRSRTRPQD